MSLEEEIVQALAAWWHDPSRPTDAEVEVFRPALAVVMPLVKRAQAEAWEEGVMFAASRQVIDMVADNPYIEQEVEHG